MKKKLIKSEKLALTTDTIRKLQQLSETDLGDVGGGSFVSVTCIPLTRNAGYCN